MDVRRIEAEGPRTARIAVIGESPWKTEAAVGRPFVGAAGNLQNSWWAAAGLERGELWIDNVYPFMPPEPAPPGDRLKSVPADVLVGWMRDLHRRIAMLPEVNVVVTTGNVSTFALLGKGNVPARIYKEMGVQVTQSEAEKKAGISKLRGSIYQYTDLHGRMLKVIPVIHASGVQQKPSWEPRTVADWRRVKEEARLGRGVVDIARVARWELDEAAVAEVVMRLACVPKWTISVDVETWGGVLTCVGVGLSASNAIVLRMRNKAERARWMPWVKAIMALPNPKVGQNVLYDLYWLRMEGVEFVGGVVDDTMCMHHTLEPQEEHSLEFLTSRYTKQRYYKDEAKDAEEIRKFARDMDALWEYNGLDCMVTLEIKEVLEEESRKAGKWEFYCKHHRALLAPLEDVMMHGLRVDKEMQKAQAKELVKECEALREELKEVAGEELYAMERKSRERTPTRKEWAELCLGEIPVPGSAPPKPKYVNREAAKRLGYIMSRGVIKEYYEVLKKDFSGEKLRRFFYEKLGVPKQRKRGRERKVTLDEVALRKIAMKYPRKAGVWPLKVILHRQKKRRWQYVKGAWDSDGRIRCSFKTTTDAGRLRSSKNPKRKGYNLQNVERGDVRKSFLADEGCVMVRVDMSQDEDRRVKMYTRMPRMIELANLRPDVYDAHTANAAAIFGIPPEKVTKEQRYLGKRAVHAAQRGMMGEKLSEVLLKDEYIVSVVECQRMIDAYHAANPEIREHYFSYVQRTYLRDGKLVNTWGREISFAYEMRMGRFGDETWRKLFSFLPQSECADNLNQNGFIPLHWWLKAEGMKARINLQNHDELIVSAPPLEAWKVVEFLVPRLETPRMYFGHELVVPACVTVGLDWGSGYEWKKMPTREEFMTVIGGMGLL